MAARVGAPPPARPIPARFDRAPHFVLRAAASVTRSKQRTSADPLPRDFTVGWLWAMRRPRTGGHPRRPLPPRTASRRRTAPAGRGTALRPGVPQSPGRLFRLLGTGSQRCGARGLRQNVRAWGGSGGDPASGNQHVQAPWRVLLNRAPTHPQRASRCLARVPPGASTRLSAPPRRQPGFCRICRGSVSSTVAQTRTLETMEVVRVASPSCKPCVPGLRF